MTKSRGKLRKFAGIVLTLAMLLGLLPVSALAAETAQFDDTAGHWGEASIQRVVEEGLFNGVGDNQFDPDGGMSRAMFVTVLYRLADKLDGPEPEGEAQSFDDVAAGSWYAQAVDWAVRAGITTGIGGGRFAPEDVVTREQMCAFLIRFLAGYMGYDLSAYTGGESFADDSDIPGWAREAVYQARALGLVQGVGENSFNPKGTATRASVAAIMDRLLDKTGELEAARPEPSPEPSKQPSGGGSGGGGGGGGGGGSTLTALKSVYILRDTADVTGQPLNPGDKLYAYVEPKVEDKTIYTLRWLVGGVEKSTESVYTVTSYDSGKTITVEAAGEAAEGYTGTVTSAATGAVSSKMDITVTDPEKSPVAVDSGATYYTKDEATDRDASCDGGRRQ